MILLSLSKRLTDFCTSIIHVPVDGDLPKPSVVQFIEVPIVSNFTCNFTYDWAFMPESMICAGVPEGGKDACWVHITVIRIPSGKWLQNIILYHISRPHEISHSYG